MFLKFQAEILHAKLLIFQGSSYTPNLVRLGVVTIVLKNVKKYNPGQSKQITVTS